MHSFFIFFLLLFSACSTAPKYQEIEVSRETIKEEIIPGVSYRIETDDLIISTHVYAISNDQFILGVDKTTNKDVKISIEDVIKVYKISEPPKYTGDGFDKATLPFRIILGISLLVAFPYIIFFL